MTINQILRVARWLKKYQHKDVNKSSFQFRDFMTMGHIFKCVYFSRILLEYRMAKKKVENCFCLKNSSLLNLVLHPLTHPSTYHGQSSFRNVKNWLQVGTLSTFLISFNDFMSICFTICLILINPL